MKKILSLILLLVVVTNVYADNTNTCKYTFKEGDKSALGAALNDFEFRAISNNSLITREFSVNGGSNILNEDNTFTFNGKDYSLRSVILKVNDVGCPGDLLLVNEYGIVEIEEFAGESGTASYKRVIATSTTITKAPTTASGPGCYLCNNSCVYHSIGDNVTGCTSSTPVSSTVCILSGTTCSKPDGNQSGQLDLCESAGPLKLIYIMKMSFSFICYMVPLLLTIMLSIDISKVVTDPQSVKKELEVGKKRIIIGLLLVFTPTIVHMLITSLGGDSDLNRCYTNATPEHYNKITTRSTRNGVSGTKAQVVSNTPDGKTYSIDTSNKCVNNVKKDGFRVDDTRNDLMNIDVSNMKVPLYVSGTDNILKTITFYKPIAPQTKNILNNVASYVYDNKDFIPRFVTAGAYVGRTYSNVDYHSYGAAIDLFDTWSYTYNGKTYKPYAYRGSNGIGVEVWNAYNEFVCEVCNGKEDCKYNINYEIFKYFFEGNGWCWGGYFGKDHFDPMHFEVRNSDTPCMDLSPQISCK